MRFPCMAGHNRTPAAGMAAQSPLAAVLTGLSALALRWRRMQLHAWRATIHKLKQRHAAGRSIPCAEHLQDLMLCNMVLSGSSLG